MSGNAGLFKLRRIAGPLVLAATVAACGLGDIATPTGTATTAPSTTSPATSATALASATLPSPSVSTKPTATPGLTPFVYTVVKNDSLVSIARRFRTSGRSIAYWNRATYPSLDPDSAKYDPNRIEIGWHLLVTPGVVYDGTGTPVPVTPSPQPTISLAPAETPPASGTGLMVTHGPRASNVVALTFDLDGRMDPALQIVQWLIDHDVPATIFPTGALASMDASAKSVLALAAAHPDLFTIGNRAWDGSSLDALTAAGVAAQLAQADAAIEPVIGRSTRPLFRPPNGTQNASIRGAAAGAGYPYTVMWDIDTVDEKAEADGGPTTDDLVTKVVSQARGGSIVLMHLGGWNTLDALPRIVDGVRSAGLVPVTLETMLGL